MHLKCHNCKWYPRLLCAKVRTNASVKFCLQCRKKSLKLLACCKEKLVFCIEMLTFLISCLHTVWYTLWNHQWWWFCFWKSLSHVEDRLHLAMHRRAGSKPLCTSTPRPARCRKVLQSDPHFTSSILNNNPFLAFWPSPSLMPVGLYAHHTELCCKSRSSLKGSVKILFFFSSLLQTMHTTIAWGCVWFWESAFSIPLTSTCFIVLICAHAVLVITSCQQRHRHHSTPKS